MTDASNEGDGHAGRPLDDERIGLAVTELLGVVTYAQLRAFQVTATAVGAAPDVRSADTLAGFAVGEHAAYVRLRDHLRELTDLPAAVLERQKEVVDAFFDAAPVHGWLSACAFFAVGLPIAADFTRQIAPSLPDRTAIVVVDALAGRTDFEAFATGMIRAHLASGDDALREVRDLVAEVVGRALTGFQGAIADTDALQVLLGGGPGEADGDGASRAAGTVRRMAVSVLDGHRRRMSAMGIQDFS